MQQQFYGALTSHHIVLVNSLCYCRWHAILFETLSGPRTITRDQATQISNDDVLQMIPESSRTEAQEAFKDFCCAFDAVLPQIELLFECEVNPFIGKNGRIDLSGTSTNGGGMTSTTPVRQCML